MAQRLKGHTVSGVESPEAGAETPDTRERILDIALDLFTTQGYETTSLREIAEQLGFSKAAIYYHFKSKDDILIALHMRLHALGGDTLRNMDPATMTLDMWAGLIYLMIDQLLANRKLFTLHERNRAALEKLHSEAHDEEHNDLEALFRSALDNKSVPVEERLRVSCAFGAVLIGAMITGDAFADVPQDQLAAMIRAVVKDILYPPATTE
jgi:AcrR family transcriptional regulator